jgi:glutathione S-transferase
MTVTLYYLSGSPYAWRVWLALEHKGIAHEIRPMSLDAGDFADPAFAALNPRRRVPVIVDDGFVLYESAAIVEYLEERFATGPRLFSPDIHQRAVQRRLVREADQYVAPALEVLVDAVLFTPPQAWSDDRIAAAYADLRDELARWEPMIGGGFLAGALSAADFTLYPELALVRRIGQRKPDPAGAGLVGPKLDAWMQRMAALPLVRQTWPPHWRDPPAAGRPVAAGRVAGRDDPA